VRAICTAMKRIFNTECMQRKMQGLKTTLFKVSLTLAKEMCWILMFNMFQTLSSLLERILFTEFDISMLLS